MNDVQPGDTVGVIGVGNMGGAIATALLNAGFRVVVHDLRPEAVATLVAQGAVAAASVRELTEQARFVSTVVVDNEQLREIARAVFEAAPPGTVLIVHSTVFPSTVVAIAEEAAVHGVSVVDAPVTGGADRASRGMLTLMVGGEPEVLDACWPLLEAVGSNVFRLGPVGSGQAMKITHNVMSLGSYTVYMDAMRFAVAHGLDEDSVIGVVTTGQADSRGLRTWGRLDRWRRQHPAFGTPAVYERINKDIQGAVVAGDQAGVDLPMITALAELFPALAERRDQDPTTWPAVPVPTCRFCGQELTVPFRANGIHPECRDQEAEGADATEQ